MRWSGVEAAAGNALPSISASPVHAVDSKEDAEEDGGGSEHLALPCSSVMWREVPNAASIAALAFSDGGAQRKPLKGSEDIVIGELLSVLPVRSETSEWKRRLLSSDVALLHKIQHAMMRQPHQRREGLAGAK